MSEKTQLPKAPEPMDYRVLDHENSWQRNKESEEEFLERYVRYTESLIESIQKFKQDERGEWQPADFVIFLDKSARPLSWMTRELWPIVAEPDAETGEVSAMPEQKFLNIDRIPWRIDPDIEITNDPENMRKPEQADIEGLRAIFTIGSTDAPIMERPSILDGKNVLFVDEVSDSGDTAYVAGKLLEQAFPDADFKDKTWMNVYSLGPQGEKIVEDVPVWYDDKSDAGRGVYGPVTSESDRANKSSRLTEGSHQFLSTRPKVPKLELSQEDREEIDALKQQLENIEDSEARAVAEQKIAEIVFETVDRKGLLLRNEMKHLVARVASLDLLPILDRHNIDDEEYVKRRTAQTSKRTGR